MRQYERSISDRALMNKGDNGGPILSWFEVESFLEDR